VLVIWGAVSVIGQHSKPNTCAIVESGRLLGVNMDEGSVFPYLVGIGIHMAFYMHLQLNDKEVKKITIGPRAAEEWDSQRSHI
jgi:hypothetical protein